ncbi:hypothetical protein ACFQZJ_11080 [Maribacter chungangensis]|uniref:Uncharacterized protein n=1 Tax=Maribacter chungangensis TaxID=1069117 RepID=A0ABW3B465_9FLAO
MYARYNWDNRGLLHTRSEVFSMDELLLFYAKLFCKGGHWALITQYGYPQQVSLDASWDFGKEKDTLFIVPLTE